MKCDPKTFSLLLLLCISGCDQKVSESRDPNGGPQESFEQNDLKLGVNTFGDRRQEILQEVASIAGNDEVTAPDWRAVKQRFWTNSLADDLQEQNIEAIGDALFSDEQGKQPIVLQILNGEFADDVTVEEQDFLIAFHTLTLMAAYQGGGAVPSAFTNRLGEKDVTRFDYYAYHIVSDAFVEMQPGSLSSSQAHEWSALASSQNPVYRLMGAKFFPRTLPEPEILLNFLGSYVNESDTTVQNAVIDSIVQSANPDLIYSLEEYQISWEPLSPELKGKLENSKTFLQRLHDKGNP